MPISITSNSAAIAAQRNVSKSSTEVERSLAKLSSGSRVFSASEDAAALAVGSGLKVDFAAFRTAQVNAAQGVSMLQIADGSLGRIADILIRAKALASNAMSDQVSDAERGYLDVEYQELMAEIDRISAATEFNGTALLGGETLIELNAAGVSVDTNDGFVGFAFTSAVNNGDVFEVDYYALTQVMTITNATQSISQTIYVDSPQVGQLNEYTFSQLGVTITLNSDFNDAVNIVHAGAAHEFSAVTAIAAAPATMEFQVGSGTDASDRIGVSIPVTNTGALGLGGTDITSSANAAVASAAIDAAIQVLNSARGDIGASMNRLQFASQNLTYVIENTESARSTLLDLDVAEELTRLSSQQVLTQTGLDMLRRANDQPDILLRLLEG